MDLRNSIIITMILVYSFNNSYGAWINVTTVKNFGSYYNVDCPCPEEQKGGKLIGPPNRHNGSTVINYGNFYNFPCQCYPGTDNAQISSPSILPPYEIITPQSMPPPPIQPSFISPPSTGPPIASLSQTLTGNAHLSLSFNKTIPVKPMRKS